MSVLETIRSRADILALDEAQTAQLCSEIREFLIQNVAKTGGHLASNLGIVELTVALQRVFDTTTDRLIFDVGHQSYVHKILTGRREQFSTLRQYGGLSGFPKPAESEQDAFVAGHASSSISAALGMARARTLLKEDYSVIALSGDGALTGGLAYEGLNDAGASGEPLIVVLNDNGMSITPNVGGIATHLSRIRNHPTYFRFKKLWRTATSKSALGRWIYRLTHSCKEFLKRSLVGSNLFEDMGFAYIGPVDGHNVQQLTYLLSQAKELCCPVIVHVLTKKGKGYLPAEHTPDLFHGVGRFDPETGEIAAEHHATFSDTFGSTLVKIAAEDSRLCAITAAMQSGTGLDAFARRFPSRFFDVGIAEGHAVTMAGGLAKQGMLPVVAIYSTFLQRAFDMILQDVAMLRSHVIFAVDRAGLVGCDGETHQGVFDVGFLREVPGITILCPSNQAELAKMLHQAVFRLDGPVVIRYPKGCDGELTRICNETVLRRGTDITLLGYGTLINSVLEAANVLQEQNISAEVLKLNCIQPLCLDAVLESAQKTGHLLIAEESVTAGCCGNEILRALAEQGCTAKVHLANLGEWFIPHGSTKQLLQCARLDGEGIAAQASEVLRHD